jgi:5-methylthioadenosine/S-adenosylhomocysteine deaminase
MFSQMRSAAGLLRAAEWSGTEPPVGSQAKDVLAAATIGGARACWLEDVIGSITPGKTADLLVLRPTRRPATLDEAYAQVLWMGDASRLESVLVAGQDML